MKKFLLGFLAGVGSIVALAGVVAYFSDNIQDDCDGDCEDCDKCDDCECSDFCDYEFEEDDVFEDETDISEVEGYKGCNGNCKCDECYCGVDDCECRDDDATSSKITDCIPESGAPEVFPEGEERISSEASSVE